MGSRTLMSIERTYYNQNVFINCPFDAEYSPLFDAIVFAVHDAGFRPRCALEASNAGKFRLEKIMGIIAECKYSIHDISRTELDPKFNLPRFNMPLELGLDLGCHRYGHGKLKSKVSLILDKTRYRYQKFISDIAGQDVSTHAGSPKQAIIQVRRWLSTESRRAHIPAGDIIYRRYRVFRRALPALCDQLNLDVKDLTFSDFSRLIAHWLEENQT